MLSKRIFVFAGGDCRDLDFYRKLIGPGDLIISADGGSRHVLAMGFHPFAVVGDGDSIEPPLQEKLERLPLKWVQNPALDQEQSDLEMALDYALSLNPTELIICGALGGSRIDHTLGNLHLLLLPLRGGVPAKIIDEGQTVQLTESELIVPGAAGDYLSLVSLTPETTGVTAEGLKYPLHGETLSFASTRTLSNELISGSARITLAAGLLLVVHTSRS